LYNLKDQFIFLLIIINPNFICGVFKHFNSFFIAYLIFILIQPLFVRPNEFVISHVLSNY